MEVKFRTKVTVKDMYSFMMNNTYRKPMGVIWILFSIAVIVVTIITWGDVGFSQSVLLIALASIYIVLNPVLLYIKAKNQIKNNDFFSKELEYTINEEEIVVTQDDQTATIKWNEVWKTVKYGKIVVLYVTNIRAFIWPISNIGDKYSDLVEAATKGIGSRNHLRKM